jgi:hypothetical protein
MIAVVNSTAVEGRRIDDRAFMSEPSIKIDPT